MNRLFTEQSIDQSHDIFLDDSFERIIVVRDKFFLLIKGMMSMSDIDSMNIFIRKNGKNLSHRCRHIFAMLTLISEPWLLTLNFDHIIKIMYDKTIIFSG